MPEFAGDECPAREPGLTHTIRKSRTQPGEWCRHCKVALTRTKDYASGAPIVFERLPPDHEVSPYILERRLLALGAFRTRAKLGFLKYLYENHRERVK